MPTVRETVSSAIATMAPPSAVKSILATLNESASAEIGSLDLASTREILGQVETGLKLFTGKVQKSSLDTLRTQITGGKAPPPSSEVIWIANDQDVIYVQRRTQSMSRGFFSGTDCVRLATAASELARNIYMYAGKGAVTLTLSEEKAGVLFSVRAEDEGPGIPNLPEIMSGNYVSRTGLGKGLKGTKALLDGLDVQSAPGKGTKIHGWKRARRT